MTHEMYEPNRYERELLAEIDRLRTAATGDTK